MWLTTVDPSDDVSLSQGQASGVVLPWTPHAQRVRAAPEFLAGLRGRSAVRPDERPGWLVGWLVGWLAGDEGVGATRKYERVVRCVLPVGWPADCIGCMQVEHFDLSKVSTYQALLAQMRKDADTEFAYVQ